MVNLGSLGISVVDTRILGCKRAYARLHPKIRPSSRQILESLDWGINVGSWNLEAIAL